jgi:hypothetical protein
VEYIFKNGRTHFCSQQAFPKLNDHRYFRSGPDERPFLKIIDTLQRSRPDKRCPSVQHIRTCVDMKARIARRSCGMFRFALAVLVGLKSHCHPLHMAGHGRSNQLSAVAQVLRSVPASCVPEVRWLARKTSGIAWMRDVVGTQMLSNAKLLNSFLCAVVLSVS